MTFVLTSRIRMDENSIRHVLKLLVGIPIPMPVRNACYLFKFETNFSLKINYSSNMTLF